ncbi:MAG TPA: S-adenosylmethionine:tRNA ribosyltransferase-isomerase [Caulobacteraceae bacterium]|nr:S-adenosylmethionine:tRNA ribosyltransferase-isomerase [Caulobacteraceae bacterium]
MIAAASPVQRPADARLLVVDRRGAIRHLPRARLTETLRPGDLVIANDAATLPASLRGVHAPTGTEVEVRLAARRSLDPADLAFNAVVFGPGDHRTLTENRPPPARLTPGDALRLGPLTVRIVRLLGHPRLIEIAFDGAADAVWAGIAHHGRPIQYAHVRQPLRLWDVWTPLAALPVAFEPPSAGFALDWALLAQLRARGVGFATLTHAAGISSTGDPALDARLPFDEAYRIPAGTAAAIEQARARGGRIIAVGTTIVRALEHAARRDGRVRPGDGLADNRLGPENRLRVVDAILSGTHEPGSSHYELLRAFTDDAVLARADAALEQHAYRTHEFGDSVLVERQAPSVRFALSA